MTTTLPPSGDTDLGVESEESMSQRAYDEIRGRIIRGEFAPGTRLRERDLAEELAISRIPLREALPQLEAHGYITTIPRRGAFVTQLTMRDVEELFDARLGVEVFATRLAAQRAAAGASMQELRAAMLRCDQALDGGDPADIAERNAQLHEAIVAACDNRLIITMMGPVHGRHRWIFRMTKGSDPQQACLVHHQLCEAIYDGNADLAAALAYAHIEAGRGPTVGSLRGSLPERRPAAGRRPPT